jgi:hypothetical protein
MAEKTEWDECTGIAKGVDWEERDPGEPAPLTDDEKAMVIQRIHALVSLKPPKEHFGKAVRWVIYVFGWTILTTSPSCPGVNFSCTFNGFAVFIAQKDAERRAEEAQRIAEEEDAGYL